MLMTLLGASAKPDEGYEGLGKDVLRNVLNIKYAYETNFGES